MEKVVFLSELQLELYFRKGVSKHKPVTDFKHNISYTQSL